MIMSDRAGSCHRKLYPSIVTSVILVCQCIFNPSELRGLNRATIWCRFKDSIIHVASQVCKSFFSLNIPVVQVIFLVLVFQAFFCTDDLHASSALHTEPAIHEGDPEDIPVPGKRSRNLSDVDYPRTRSALSPQRLFSGLQVPQCYRILVVVLTLSYCSN
ncbi:hypothetical protein BJV78DRAFT_1243818 [Lactifluus subvellereus]|nr:hypothetical protein BJV78DRAFT_1243818 [Lactifluus subvellereus]